MSPIPTWPCLKRVAIETACLLASSFTVASPGNQNTLVGTAVSLQIHASDSASGQTLSYSATGLPAGLSINSTTGLISGTPTSAGTSVPSIGESTVNVIGCWPDVAGTW